MPTFFKILTYTPKLWILLIKLLDANHSQNHDLFFWILPYPDWFSVPSRALYEVMFFAWTHNSYCINLQYPDLIYCALHKLSSIVQKLYNYCHRKCLILLHKSAALTLTLVVVFYISKGTVGVLRNTKRWWLELLWFNYVWRSHKVSWRTRFATRVPNESSILSLAQPKA